MLTWLAITLGVAVGSALCPLISVELFVIGLVAAPHHPGLTCWALGAVIAVGQVAGKLLYYYAGRGDIPLPKFLRPKQTVDQRPSTWLRRLGKRCSEWFHLVRDRCERHQGWLIGTTGVSAVIGLPPFMATTILAGVARMSLAAFLITTLSGRFLRFTVLAASPGLVTGLLPHLG